MLNVGAFRSTDGGKTMVSVRRAATRTTSGSIPTTRSTSSTPTTAAAPCRSTRRRRSGRGRRATIRPGSSITSSRPDTCRITSAARSRTAARSACRATPGIGGGGRRRWRRPRRRAGDLQRRRRRARLHRARSEGPRRLLRRRQQRLVPDAAQSHAPARRREVGPVSAHVLRRALERAGRALAVDVSRSSSRRVDPNVLYTSSQHVWKTTNGGQTWDSDQRRPHAPRSEDDGRVGRTDHARHEQPGGLRDGVRARRRARRTSTSSGPDRTTASCSVTRDGGKTWTNVTPKDMPDLGRVSQIDASAFDAGTAYVAVKKPLLDDLAPYIFRTHDFGKTWTKIVTGIRPNDYVHVGPRGSDAPRAALRRHAARLLRLVRRRRSLGVAVAEPAGHAGVGHLIVEANSISRSRRTAAASTSSTTSRRCGSPARTSTTGGRRLSSSSPPTRSDRTSGATIAYLLKKPAQKLTIEILDARGQVVRTFAGGAATGRGRGGRGAAEPMRPLLHLPRRRRPPPVKALPRSNRLRQPGQRRTLMQLPAADAAAAARRPLRWRRA